MKPRNAARLSWLPITQKSRAFSRAANDSTRREACHIASDSPFVSQSALKTLTSGGIRAPPKPTGFRFDSAGIGVMLLGG